MAKASRRLPKNLNDDH